MLFLQSLLAVLVFHALRTVGLSAPPSGAITVGPGGKYSTLSAALKDTSSSVSALSSRNSHAGYLSFLRKVYFVFPGTFTEQVVISRPNVRIFGQTSNPQDYTGNSG